MSMDPREETAGRGYNPTLPSGRRKKPKKKAPKKPAPKKPAPKPAAKKNSTGGDQPVRVGRGGKQVTPAKTSSKEPRMSESGKYGPWNPKPQTSMFPKGNSKSKPKGPKDGRGFGQRVVEAEAAKKPVKPKSYPKSVKR